MRVAAWLVVAALAGGGCFTRHDAPGTLPNEALTVVRLDVAPVKSETVDDAGEAITGEGTLTTVRWSGGAFSSFSRFGTISGITGSLAMGWLGGDAASRSETGEAKRFYADIELGGMIMPLYTGGKRAVASLAGDFGIGISRDDRYGYAGGRAALGSFTRTLGVDLLYRRRFGETTGNPGAHEDRFGAVISVRPGARRVVSLQLGVELVLGDQRILDGDGMEVADDELLLKGRYRMIAVTLGIGGGAPRQAR